MGDAGGKAGIRKRVLGLRDALDEADRKLRDALIAERVAAEPSYARARSILFYASFRSEVGTGALIVRALAEGRRAVLPRVDSGRGALSLRMIGSLSDARPGYMGIPEPPETAEEVPLDGIDLVVVPGVAFDTQCVRVGYGGGYYDRLFAGCRRRPVLLAPAYEVQIVEAIPSEAHDVRMDMIVTEGRTIVCGAG